MTGEEIYRAGLEALRRELGLVGMVRFLQMLEKGQGDYSAERHAWLDEMDLAAALAEIDQRRKQMQTPQATSDGGAREQR